MTSAGPSGLGACPACRCQADTSSPRRECQGAARRDGAAAVWPRRPRGRPGRGVGGRERSPALQEEPRLCPVLHKPSACRIVCQTGAAQEAFADVVTVNVSREGKSRERYSYMVSNCLVEASAATLTLTFLVPLKQALVLQAPSSRKRF